MPENRKRLAAGFIVVATAVACSSCTLRVKGVCVSGPNKGQFITARASYNGFGSGTIQAIAPWGERAEGRYVTSRSRSSTTAWRADSRFSSDAATTEGDDVRIQADGTTQVGTALLLGDQGTSFDVVYWGNAWNPTHGQGRVRDTRGNSYRLVW